MVRREWIVAGRRLAQRKERDLWALGDWAVEGEREYGDLATAAEEIGVDYRVLRNCATVSRKVEVSRRRDSLSWSHHAAIAALPVAEGDELLSVAQVEGWSREVIRQEARAVSELHTLRAENARLKRALADAGTSRAAARRTERQVRDACKGITRTYRDLAATVREAVESPALAALHGNARNALGARLAQIVEAARADADDILATSLLPAIGAFGRTGRETAG